MFKKFPFLTNYRLVWLLWIVVAVALWLYKYGTDRINNYLIFKYVYLHTIAQVNLYDLSKDYYDSNHYGPVFSMVMAPFALMSDVWGLFFWNMLNALALLWAVHMLPIKNKVKIFVLLFSVVEFANAAYSIQFNAVVTAMIIFSFVLVQKGKDTWATLLIVLGALVKLYPIVGLAFFIFSKNKGRFILTTAIWAVVFFCLPMFITSPSFVLQSYADWFHSLREKNEMNIGFNAAQDISFMGVCRRVLGMPQISNTPFLLFGALVFGMPLLRFNQYDSLQFRLRVLASSLLTVVLFSTGSEHPTYIIAVIGATLWIFLQEKMFSQRNIILLVLLVVVTGLGLTDAFPKYIREDIVTNYVLKAWPCIIIWFMIAYELVFVDFTDQKCGSKQREPESLFENKLGYKSQLN